MSHHHWFLAAARRALALGCIARCLGAAPAAQDIPLPEHPRPDFVRERWVNLNGAWKFRFDPHDTGIKDAWQTHAAAFDRTINVPFPWGAPLSGVADEGDIGWYARSIRIPEAWRGARIFLVIGACDWHTTAWLDGKALGEHRGGYTPFEFELTAYAVPGNPQELVLRVDDAKRPFLLEGKQGYGPARGIWQTPYIEARGAAPLGFVHFSPDLDGKKVTVHASLCEPAAGETAVNVRITKGARLEAGAVIAAGARECRFDIAIPRPRLWTLEDPFLYEAEAACARDGAEPDVVRTYFGMRAIGTGVLPGTSHSYITLNGKPVYLQTTLDQAYHPEGFYTFPSDDFMRDEILRSRRIGLNGMRIHVKVGIPRKLYWADRLGMLIMADVPNSWGEPTEDMRRESEFAMRGMLRRDFNHPSIFAWVLFNETWGLVTKDKGYTEETQTWVEKMYLQAKALDPTRLVEDNSPCHNDHVATDINSWHAYLPGYKWAETLDEYCAKTHPGSPWNFVPGRVQGSQPNFNSECGNVWGYKGSTGDVDWSWDYHRMMDAFRRHPAICGWLYTEHHDVINEWNGYWRYDRSEKFTGLEELAAGMTLRDLHAPYYLAVGDAPCREVEASSAVKVPLWASIMAEIPGRGRRLIMRATLHGWDTLGRPRVWRTWAKDLRATSWMSQAIEPLDVVMPDRSGLAVLAIALEEPTGLVLQRNFTTFLVTGGRDVGEKERLRLVRIDPKSFARAEWSVKQWNVLGGLKVNGAGAGFFEYRVPWPEDLDPAAVTGGAFVIEASAKQLFGKDREGVPEIAGDFMRGKGTHDPSRNPNSYPMTDTDTYPSAVAIRVAGQAVGTFDLPDDPADHRGILSWHAQPQDGTLKEAGSYGYLLRAAVGPAALKRAAKAKEIVIRLEVDSSLPGGLAVYGARFGRYPLDPTLVITVK